MRRQLAEAIDNRLTNNFLCTVRVGNGQAEDAIEPVRGFGRTQDF